MTIDLPIWLAPMGNNVIVVNSTTIYTDIGLTTPFVGLGAHKLLVSGITNWAIVEVSTAGVITFVWSSGQACD
jgi:hypothetical protein